MNRVDALAAFAWAALVVLAARAAWPGARRARRARARQLVAYLVLVTGFAGVSGRDLWPLSSWALMVGIPPEAIDDAPMALELVAVDADGREWPVDYRAVEPLAFDEVRAWLRGPFLRLERPAQDSAARWLLDRIEAARMRVRAGGSAAEVGEWMGPLRAPYHSLHPAWWRRPDDVGASRFVSLRIYREWWTLAARAADPGAVRRVRLYASPPGPSTEGER